MNLAPYLRQRFLDPNGVLLASGQLFSYAAGTTTPQATYSNTSGTPNANPVVLDSQGYADVWLDPALAYKFVLKDANGVQQWTVDNVTVSTSGITTWSTNTTYQQGQLVADSSGFGLLYASLINNNTGNALTNVSAWRIFGGNVRSVSTNTTLLVTDDLVRSNSTSGNLTHTLPTATSIPTGKEITVIDAGSGGNTTSVGSTVLVNGAACRFKNNGTTWDALTSLPDGSVSTAKIQNGAITQAKRAALGQAISPSSGAYTTTATTMTAVTNLAVSIATTGRPVMIVLQPDGSGNAGIIQGNHSSVSAATVGIALGRDGVTSPMLAEWSLGIDVLISGATYLEEGITFNPGFVFLDTPAAGSHTYQVYTKCTAIDSVQFQYCKLVAFEL